jgi:hypothetical protein
MVVARGPHITLYTHTYIYIYSKHNCVFGVPDLVPVDGDALVVLHLVLEHVHKAPTNPQIARRVGQVRRTDCMSRLHIPTPAS